MRLIMGLCGAIACLAGASPAAAQGDAADPAVCLSRPFHIEGLETKRCFLPSELTRVLDRPVLAGNGVRPRAVRLTHPDKDDETVEAASCRDYLKLADAGWFALTTRDMAVESYYQRNCLALRYIEEAQPAQRSGLAEGHSPLADVNQLPGAILSSLDPESDVNALQDQDIPPLQLILQAGQAEVLESGKDSLKLRFGGAEAVYEEIARGDFDGDGLADALVFGTAHQIGGSASWTFPVVLTRDPGRRLYRAIDIGG